MTRTARTALAWSAARALGPAACVSAFLGGCLATSDPGVDSRDPARRMEAMVDAAAARDRAAVPGLITRLDSQDAGERLVAIKSLERITGKTFGYDYAGPATERAAAIARWQAWSTDGKE